MKFKAIALLATLALVASVGAQTSNPKYIKEQNDHAISVQQKAQAARQQDNRSVNNNIQQQRYNNTRPTTSTPASRPVTPAYKAPAPAYKAPVPTYKAPATSSYSSSSYKRK